MPAIWVYTRLFLIKYVLTEKTGLNLRNQVAHGLMDINEYSSKYCIIIFCIIMKLSKYKFVETKEGHRDENNSERT